MEKVYPGDMAEANTRLRDTFAAAALSGILTSSRRVDGTPEEVRAAFASEAYLIADAMLRARDSSGI